ncbi:MAG: tyrosine-type recombinase/integrase [Planctomycetales bacterium]|nr:tyrosine-type recombinase/integrase [Planctomycetales bacterium]
MARPSKPWFRKQNKTWYVEIGGKQHNLGKDKVTAEQTFHELMLAKSKGEVIRGPILAVEVADKFIGWCIKHRSPRTASDYQHHLEAFYSWLPGGKLMVAAELKPYHVIEYIDSRDSWGNSRKRQAAGAVQRSFKWAVSVGLLDLHPCTSIPKPKGERREDPMTAEEYRLILEHTDKCFGDVVQFAWETGARPHEIRTMRPEYVRGDRIEFPTKKSKGKKHSRVIYLNDVARKIVDRRLTTATEFVFTNARGGAWTAYSLNKRLDRIKDKVGRKVCLYRSRHAFTERLLDKGIDHLTVAALLGHTNGQMVASVYSHRNKADDALRRAIQ